MASWKVICACGWGYYAKSLEDTCSQCGRHPGRGHFVEDAPARPIAAREIRKFAAALKNDHLLPEDF